MKASSNVIAVRHPRPLDGYRILIVEDEFFLADDLARALTTAGAEIIGPVNEVADALEIVRGTRVDAGVLDINVRGVLIYSLAEELKRRCVPFVFATGYDQGAIPAQFNEVARWEKPFDPDALALALPEVIGWPKSLR